MKVSLVDESKIRNLDKLTSDLNNYVLSNKNDVVEYKTKNGVSIGINLFNNDEVAVQRCYNSKGSIFPRHQHEEIEHIIVYEGRIRVENGVDDTIVEEGQGMVFEPYTPHKIEMLEDTWLIGVTIPSSKNYPGKLREG